MNKVFTGEYGNNFKNRQNIRLLKYYYCNCMQQPNGTVLCCVNTMNTHCFGIFMIDSLSREIDIGPSPPCVGTIGKVSPSLSACVLLNFPNVGVFTSQMRWLPAVLVSRIIRLR